MMMLPYFGMPRQSSNFYEDNDDDKTKPNIKKKGEMMSKVLGRIIK
jgi:hypothetical protein